MPLPTQPVGTLERVYTALYVLDAGGEAGNDQVLYLHPNGLCVVCLAPSHALLRAPGEALTVRFSGEGDGGAPAPVSGKHKRNAPPPLRAVAVLARVTAGEQAFGVRACVRAALLEANERLLSEPALLREAPHAAGFVAVLRPADAALAELRATALTPDAYHAAIAARDTRL